MHCDVRVENGKEGGVKKGLSLRDCASKGLQDFMTILGKNKPSAVLYCVKGRKGLDSHKRFSIFPSHQEHLLKFCPLRL